MVSRAFFLTVVVSGVDELCELWWRSSYANFKECWCVSSCVYHPVRLRSDPLLPCAAVLRRWDHIILDLILTNALGAYLGAKVPACASAAVLSRRLTVAVPAAVLHRS